MKRQCRATGCYSPAASSFAHYCSAHKANHRRHGAPDQKGISKAHLEPYLKIVRARIRKNPQSPAWAALEARWQGLVDHARGIQVTFQRGLPGSRIERKAAEEVLKLAADVEPRAILEVVAAMVVMQELEPRRFCSDRAFWMQIARRVRGLTDVNFGERYMHTTGKVKRVYREMTPDVMRLLGHWLVELLGIGGVHIARLESQEAQRRASEREQLHAALGELA